MTTPIEIVLIHQTPENTFEDPICLQDDGTITCDTGEWKINSIFMQNKNGILRITIDEEKLKK